jgi:sterol 14-demethylase
LYSYSPSGLTLVQRKVIDDIEVPATLGSPSENEPYVIPKGHFLLACPAASQVDPIEWPEANVWEPTRWTDPQGVAARAAKQYDDADGEKIDYGFGLVSKGTDSIYQPFGAGRHRCIGETFAYLQLSVIIATFVRNLELKIQHRVPDHNYHVCLLCFQLFLR